MHNPTKLSKLCFDDDASADWLVEGVIDDDDADMHVMDPESYQNYCGTLAGEPDAPSPKFLK